jgi:hypothetical protein
MATVMQATQGSEKVALGKLPIAGLIGGGIAIVGNVILYLLTRVLNISMVMPMGGPDGPVMDMPIFAPIFATLIPAIGATILLALLGRFTKRPYRIFVITAVVFFILTIFTPFTTPLSLAGQLILLAMHVVAAVGITWGLVRFSQA